MRYAIVADIHSNLAAFKSVLADIEMRGGADEIWCLGDVVGYGPDPHQCLELLRQYRRLCVAGNHDWAAIGKVNTSFFNPEAASACHWTSGQLTAGDVSYLDSLPLKVEREGFTLVHGSPRDPIWEYVALAGIAQQNFSHFTTQYCLVGHSHVPAVFGYNMYGACIAGSFPGDGVLKLADSRYIINPGGVGQPRDGDPRASYAIYDSEERAVAHYRVSYDIGETQSRMLKRGLPDFLRTRLSYGL